LDYTTISGVIFSDCRVLKDEKAEGKEGKNDKKGQKKRGAIQGKNCTEIEK